MVNMKGNTRLLDKVLTDNGTASARTLEVYGVTSIDELLNVPMLVKSNIDGVDTATMKINTLDAKDIKIMKGNEKVSPYNQWVMSGQLYQLIYDGFQFVAYPFGASGGNESNDYSVMKLDFNAFSTSTKDNLITNVGAETLGELFYNLEQNVDCDYTFIKNSNNEIMNMPCIFDYHEYVSSLSLHTVMLSTFYDKILYTFTIEYSYGADDSLSIMDYNISQINLQSSGGSSDDAKYAGATRAYRVKSDSSGYYPVVGVMSGDTTPIEYFNDYKTKYADDLFTLSSDGTYITVNKRCLLDFKGDFTIMSTNSSNISSSANVTMTVYYEDNDIGGLMHLASSNAKDLSIQGTIAYGTLIDTGYHLVEAGTKIYVAVINNSQTSINCDITAMAFYVHCTALA